jgi:lipoprotein-releasing system permease protein
MIGRLIAMRYLKAGSGGGFARVVTWFSFVGIALGVATLIIVM